MYARHSHLILVLLGITAIGCAPIPSPKFKTLQKTARFWGIGWSEGYHQCPKCFKGPCECDESSGWFGKRKKKKDGLGICTSGDCNGACGGSCGQLVSGPSVFGKRRSFLGHSNVAGFQLDATAGGFQLVNIPPRSGCGCGGTVGCSSCSSGLGYSAVPYQSSCGGCGAQAGFSTPGCVSCGNHSAGLGGQSFGTLNYAQPHHMEFLDSMSPEELMPQPNRMPKIVTPNPTPVPPPAPVPDSASDKMMGSASDKMMGSASDKMMGSASDKMMGSGTRSMELEESSIDLGIPDSSDSLLNGDSFDQDQLDGFGDDDLDSLLPSPSDVDATSVDGRLLPRRPELPPAPAVGPLSLQSRPRSQLRGQPIRKPGFRSAEHQASPMGFDGYTANRLLLNRYAR